MSKTDLTKKTIQKTKKMSNTDLTNIGGRRGHDRMIVGFTTTYAISAYHH
jgi:hypothetical protein